MLMVLRENLTDDVLNDVDFIAHQQEGCQIEFPISPAGLTVRIDNYQEDKPAIISGSEWEVYRFLQDLGFNVQIDLMTQQIAVRLQELNTPSKYMESYWIETVLLRRQFNQHIGGDEMAGQLLEWFNNDPNRYCSPLVGNYATPEMRPAQNMDLKSGKITRHSLQGAITWLWPWSIALTQIPYSVAQYALSHALLMDSPSAVTRWELQVGFEGMLERLERIRVGR